MNLDVFRELVSEASEYAGPEDEDLSSNTGIWRAIEAAEAELRKPQPMTLSKAEARRLKTLLRRVEKLAQAWADVGEVPGAKGGDEADAAAIASDVVQAWRGYLGLRS